MWKGILGFLSSPWRVFRGFTSKELQYCINLIFHTKLSKWSWYSIKIRNTVFEKQVDKKENKTNKIILLNRIKIGATNGHGVLYFGTSSSRRVRSGTFISLMHIDLVCRLRFRQNNFICQVQGECCPRRFNCGRITACVCVGENFAPQPCVVYELYTVGYFVALVTVSRFQL